MKTKHLFFSIILCALAGSAAAQVPEAQENLLNVGEVTVVNLGDGRMLHREAESKTPLQGEHRIIDGIRSEYTQAAFTDGLFDGPWAHYKHNLPAETGAYRQGLRHGTFTEYYSDGRRIKSETPYTDGKRDGMRRTYYTDGSLEMEKEYRQGQEHGIERRWDYGAQEPRSEHNYYAGKKDGRQITRFVSNVGDYYEESNFNMGSPVGEFLQRWSDGTIRTRGQYNRIGDKDGVWIESRRDGSGDNDDDNWKRYEIVYKNGEAISEKRYRGE
jgi:antitoxin component YwqK of YwqJK toxin-antitoxin module